MNARTRTSRRFFTLLMLATLIGIGAVRVASAAADDYGPGLPVASATDDAVTIRRSMQLVTVAVEALAATAGLCEPASANPAKAELPGDGGVSIG